MLVLDVVRRERRLLAGPANGHPRYAHAGAGMLTVHSIDVDEIGRENAAGLYGQELLPRRTRTARCEVPYQTPD